MLGAHKLSRQPLRADHLRAASFSAVLVADVPPLLRNSEQSIIGASTHPGEGKYTDAEAPFAGRRVDMDADRMRRYCLGISDIERRDCVSVASTARGIVTPWVGISPTFSQHAANTFATAVA